MYNHSRNDITRLPLPRHAGDRAPGAGSWPSHAVILKDNNRNIQIIYNTHTHTLSLSLDIYIYIYIYTHNVLFVYTHAYTRNDINTTNDKTIWPSHT